jgi:hypothetical protein
MKITCSKTELRKFKARAGRRYPEEYIETLWGIRNGKRGCNVLLVSMVPQDGTAHAVNCHEEG